MSVKILQGHVLDVLPTIAPATFHTCVTSIPYWQLRSYGTEPQVWANPDGTPLCVNEHEWETERYYREGGNSSSSSLAFSEPGPENAQRLKDTRWRSNTICQHCGAWRGEWGQEPTPEMYVDHTVAVFEAVRRVLRNDGTLWLNIGDTYWNDPGGQNGSEGWVGEKAKEANRQMGRRKRSTGSTDPVLKRKDLVGIPWRVAFALQAAGWYLRSEIIWHKPNPMPESCTDRPTKAHEYVFLLTKRGDYFYDREAIMEPVSGTAHSRGNGLNPKAKLNGYAPGQESANQPRLHRQKVPAYWDTDPGAHGRIQRRPRQNESFSAAVAELVDQRNKRSVWTIPLNGFSEAHFATFPPALVEPCIKAGTSERGCCPTCGAPWGRIVARAPAAPRIPGSAKSDAASERMATRNMLQRTRGARANGGAHDNPFPPPVTLGWQQACSCPPHEPVPCTVLDICFGSGTTGVVGDRLGRDVVGIDLHPDYVVMAERRIKEDAPMFTEVAAVLEDARQATLPLELEKAG